MNSKIIITESSQGYTACVDKLTAKGVPVVTARRIAVAIADQEPFTAENQALIDQVLDRFFSKYPSPTEVRSQIDTLFFAVMTGLLLIRTADREGQSAQHWNRVIGQQAAALIDDFNSEQMQAWLNKYVRVDQP